MARKKIKFEEEATSKILVADTDSESGAEASEFEDYFKEEEEDKEEEKEEEEKKEEEEQKKKKRRDDDDNNNNNNNNRNRTASLSRSRTTGCNKWQIVNLGTASRKEHKYSSFYQSSTMCEKKSGSSHEQRQLTTVCVDVVFHRNFSSAGGTDQCILPATLRQTSWT